MTQPWIGCQENGEPVSLDAVLADDALVLDHSSLESLFKGLCVRCLAPTRVVHELEPKSLGQNWERWSNRVTLCHACHDWAHGVGTRVSRVSLICHRNLRLLLYYGVEYPSHNGN